MFLSAFIYSIIKNSYLSQFCSGHGCYSVSSCILICTASWPVNRDANHITKLQAIPNSIAGDVHITSYLLYRGFICICGLCGGTLFPGVERSLQLPLPCYPAHHEGLSIPLWCHSPLNSRCYHWVRQFILFHAVKNLNCIDIIYCKYQNYLAWISWLWSLLSTSHCIQMFRCLLHLRSISYFCLMILLSTLALRC